MKFRKFVLLFAALFGTSASQGQAQTAGALSRPTAVKTPVAPAPKPPNSPAGVLGDIQLTQVRLSDAARMLSQVGKANVVVTGKVADEIVSLYLHDATVEDMVRNLCRAAGVWYRFDSASKTYVVMSGEEYQKDLAIVRDEQTQVFTLRHHNVVATANAVKALFGARVALSVPIEEMPPASLGSGNRTSAGGGNNNKGSSSAAGSGGASGLSGGTSVVQTPAAGSGSGGNASSVNYDPVTDLNRMSQDRLDSQLRIDSSGRQHLGIAGIQEMAARQGPPVHVTYNKLNNLLMVRTGDDATLRQIAQLIAEMDQPPKQVLLEMKILEVTLDDGFKSVFDLGIAGGRVSRNLLNGTKTSSSVDISNGVLQTTNSSSTTGGATEYVRNAFSGGFSDELAGASYVWQLMSKSLSLQFQLLAQENKLKVLSSPMLVAANNQPARLFIGDERVLTVGASSQSTTGTTGATNTQITVETEKRDVGQTLSILPRINGDRSISLTIDQDSSTVKLKDGSIPISTSNGQIVNFPIDTVNTASLQVTAHAQDGMTVAIGGMIRDSVQRDNERVPILGDIPFIGTLFKHDVRATVRSQIVLLITPRVLENPTEANRVAQAKTEDFNALAASVPTSPIMPKLTDTSPTPPASGIAAGRDGDAGFAALARAAAAAVRQTDPAASPPEGLRAVPLNDHSRLQLANGMEARPSASWQRDGLYVTALQVINSGAQAQGLAATLIRGRWAAMVLERRRLGAAGSSDSWTWAYAISRQPFEQAVEAP